ncbi:MAG: RiPP maturation radical SAM C-methyltransferase [Thermoanaerobaculia bacterium]
MPETQHPTPGPSRADVCLVNMPYASLNRPSLALGLLKAVLSREGIATSVLYPNLTFAERIGLRLYHLCSSQLPKDFLVGEWTFAEAAFRDAARASEEEYLARIAARHASVHGYHRDAEGAGRLREDLRTVRRAVDGFIGRAARRVLSTGARVVGCTSTFEQHAASLALLRHVRELDPRVITVLGGANCEGVMGRATHRNFPWVDYVVAGEADALVGDLCRRILAEGRDIPAAELPAGVHGPASRQGEAAAEAKRPVFRALDSLPVPDFGDYFRALGRFRHAAAVLPGLPLETSRGCWWGAVRHCTFCGLNGSTMTFRSKSPERVHQEIRELEERYGISRFETVDNILDMGYFQSLLPALAADGGERRRIFYEVKANLRRSQVEALRRAGILWLQPGIESLHSAVLELMNKGIQAWQNVQLLKACRELGVRLSWNFLWGFPGEEDAWYAEMVPWLPALEHLQPPSGVTRVRFDRFSPYHQRPETFGLALRPAPAAPYVYPLPDEELLDLTYYFAAAGRPDPFSGEGGEILEGRPGVRAIQEWVGAWQIAFWMQPPVLTVEDDGEGLDFEDTRSCAVERSFRLAGLDRAVYLAAQDAPVADRLASVLAERQGLAASPEEAAAAVERLARRSLVLPVDRRLLALGLRGPLPELPGVREFPGGMVEDGAYQWA